MTQVTRYLGSKITVFHPTTGKPLVGGKVYCREPGTQNPRAAYQDAGGEIAHPHPIILDAQGSAIIFLVGVYDIHVTDASDTDVETFTNVEGTLTEGQVQGAIDAAVSSVSLNYGVLNISSDTTLTAASAAAKLISIDASGGAVEVTVPDPATMTNQVPFILRRSDAVTANTVTVKAHAAELFEGQAAYYLAPGEMIEMRTDGTNWWFYFVPPEVIPRDTTYTGRIFASNKIVVQGQFPEMIVNDTQNGGGKYIWQRNGLDRWRFGQTAETESGSNAGSNLSLENYNDAGVRIGDVVKWKRDDKGLQHYGPVTIGEETPGNNSPNLSFLTDWTDQRTRMRCFHVPGSKAGIIMEVGSTGPVYFEFTNDGWARSAAGWTTYSDASLKENLEPILDVEAKLDRVRGYLYDRIDLDGKRMAGLLANEWQVILPESVGVGFDDKLTLEPMGPIAMLLEGWHLHRKKIAELEDRLSSLLGE